MQGKLLMCQLLPSSQVTIKGIQQAVSITQAAEFIHWRAREEGCARGLVHQDGARALAPPHQAWLHCCILSILPLLPTGSLLSLVTYSDLSLFQIQKLPLLTPGPLGPCSHTPFPVWNPGSEVYSTGLPTPFQLFPAPFPLLLLMPVTVQQAPSACLWASVASHATSQKHFAVWAWMTTQFLMPLTSPSCPTICAEASKPLLQPRPLPELPTHAAYRRPDTNTQIVTQASSYKGPIANKLKLTKWDGPPVVGAEDSKLENYTA